MFSRTEVSSNIIWTSQSIEATALGTVACCVERLDLQRCWWKNLNPLIFISSNRQYRSTNSWITTSEECPPMIIFGIIQSESPWLEARHVIFGLTKNHFHHIKTFVLREFAKRRRFSRRFNLGSLKWIKQRTSREIGKKKPIHRRKLKNLASWSVNDHTISPFSFHRGKSYQDFPFLLPFLRLQVRPPSLMNFACHDYCVRQGARW